MSKRNEGYNSVPGYYEARIKTKDDRRSEAIASFAEGLKDVVGIEGSLSDHLKHRLSLKTIGKEVFNHFTDKVLPQGADEAANFLFTGSTYLPWPGSSGPAPIPHPEPQIQSIHEAGSHMVTSKEGPSDPYLSGRGYTPEPSPGGPGGMYFSEGGRPGHVPKGSRSADSPTEPYLTGSYEPQVEPPPGGPSGMYLQQLDQAARRGRDDDQGHTR